MRYLLCAAALALALPAPSWANEQDPYVLEDASLGRAEDIRAVLEGHAPADRVFAPSFLAAVSPSQLKAIADQLIAANGVIKAVDDVSYTGNGAASFDIVFEKGRASATLQLDGQAPYLVTGFRIGAVTPVDDAPAKLLADFAALPGHADFGVFLLGSDGPQPILTSSPTGQMAIGSTFKLYVLSALAQDIKAGKRQWGDVVTLDARSIPSGQMQNWPAGSPVTLHTLATMMVSISDNTATDMLMRVLGREAVEAEVITSGHSEPSRILPMLSTVEFFALKNDPARIATWQAADDARQRALLKEWAPTLTVANVDVGKLATSGPTAIDSIEWFASAEDIARILMRLRDSGDSTALDILAVNPMVSPEQAAHWGYAGYKGGSETGVLNLSWLLKDKQGRWFVIAASWNDPAAKLEDTKLIMLAQRLAGMLQK